MRLSIVTPAFNEGGNLEALHVRISEVMATAGLEWEWIVIDDHSRDDTFDVVRRLSAADRRVAGLRLARNSGSHTAISCGLHHVTGDAAVVLAADLQDPPEVLPTLVDEWRKGAQVVWAVRRIRHGESTGKLGFSRLYWAMMRGPVGLSELPARGADLFLIDRRVIDAFRSMTEQPVSVFALITWMGFRQVSVDYDKQPRSSGRSGWSVQKKLALVVDSVTGFSDFPIRWCAYAGVGLIVLAPPVALFARSLVALLLALAGLQLLAIGVVGEYVWRGVQEARQRPAFLIEAVAGVLSPNPAERAHR